MIALRFFFAYLEHALVYSLLVALLSTVGWLGYGALALLGVVTPPVYRVAGYAPSLLKVWGLATGALWFAVFLAASAGAEREERKKSL